MVLTPDTRALATPDNQLIRTFLDGEQMRPVFGSLPWIAGAGLVIRECVVDSVRYNSRAKDRKLRRPFLCAAYRLVFTDARHAEQIVYAELHPDPRVPKPADDFRQHAVHLPELDATVWAFPHDPQVPHLVDVMDPERVRHHLPFDRLPAGLDGPTDVRDVRADVLRYKPETHCAARYEIGWDDGIGGQRLTLFGKTYALERARDIHRQIELVWQKSHEQPESFVIARALGYALAVRTVWQAALVGQPLLPVVRGGGDCRDVLSAVGTALAILHETEAVSGITVSLADQLAEMRAQIDALVEAFPEARATLDPVAARLFEQAPSLQPVPATLVHGDFIAKNLELHGGRLVVLDFDDFVFGDPVQDVARFLIDLHFFEDRDSHRVTLRPCAPQILAARAHAFTTAYRARARWNVGEASLDWHWRVQWIHKIHYYFKRQHLRPGFEQDLHAMLARLR